MERYCVAFYWNSKPCVTYPYAETPALAVIQARRTYYDGSFTVWDIVPLTDRAAMERINIWHAAAKMTPYIAADIAAAAGEEE